MNVVHSKSPFTVARRDKKKGRYKWISSALIPFAPPYRGVECMAVLLAGNIVATDLDARAGGLPARAPRGVRPAGGRAAPRSAAPVVAAAAPRPRP